MAGRATYECRSNMKVLYTFSASELDRTESNKTKGDDFVSTVSPEVKKGLIRKSQFCKLVNNGADIKNNLPIFLKICSLYDKEDNTFLIKNKKMNMTVDDVAFLLGLNSKGEKPTDLESKVWDLPLKNLLEQYAKGKKADTNLLERSNIELTLKKMEVNDEDQKKLFRRLFSFYLLSFIVYPRTAIHASLSNFVFVRDIDVFEKVNWAAEMLAKMLENVKLYKEGSTQRFVPCFTKLLEAWYVMKMEIVDVPNPMEAAPISLYLKGSHTPTVLASLGVSEKPRKPSITKKEKPRKQSESDIDPPGSEKNPSEKIEYHTKALLEAISEEFVRRAILAEKPSLTELGLPCDEEVMILKLKQKHCGSAKASFTTLVEAFGGNQGLCSPSETRREDISNKDKEAMSFAPLPLQKFYDSAVQKQPDFSPSSPAKGGSSGKEEAKEETGANRQLKGKKTKGDSGDASNAKRKRDDSLKDDDQTRPQDGVAGSVTSVFSANGDAENTEEDVEGDEAENLSEYLRNKPAPRRSERIIRKPSTYTPSLYAKPKPKPNPNPKPQPIPKPTPTPESDSAKKFRYIDELYKYLDELYK